MSGRGSVSEVVDALQKDAGETVGSIGVDEVQVARCPTGWFELDANLGGGIPLGAVSIFYGAEGASKTTLALNCIAQYQRLWPDRVCGLIDQENSYDPVWGAGLGVQNDKLAYFRPEYGEQAVNSAQGFLHADDAGLLVVDSLAALFPLKDVEGDAEDVTVGAQARLCRNLVARVGSALIYQRRDNDGLATVIYISQTRSKIGKAAMFGNPETFSGGNAPRFQSQMTLRLWGKEENDAKINKHMPPWKKISVICRKWKVPILSKETEEKMSLVPGTGLAPGTFDNRKAIKALSRQYGVLTDAKKGYDYDGTNYAKQDDFADVMLADPQLRAQLLQDIFAAARRDDGVIDEGHT